MSASRPAAPATPGASRLAVGTRTAAAGGSRLDALRAQPRREGVASHFYRDTAFDCDAVKVLPGEYWVDDREIVIVTVLGSCIAACLYDRTAGVGGMNHFMLPDGGADASGRYGAYAMEVLINELQKRGAQRSRIEAKVFGGGRVMQGFTAMNIGEQNAAFVERFLAAERIPIVSRDVLDIHPRKVCLFPVTGRALVKKLAAASVDPTLVEESRYRQRIVQAPAAGSVELF